MKYLDYGHLFPTGSLLSKQLLSQINTLESSDCNPTRCFHNSFGLIWTWLQRLQTVWRGEQIWLFDDLLIVFVQFSLIFILSLYAVNSRESPDCLAYLWCYCIYGVYLFKKKKKVGFFFVVSRRINIKNILSKSHFELSSCKCRWSMNSRSYDPTTSHHLWYLWGGKKRELFLVHFYSGFGFMVLLSSQRFGLRETDHSSCSRIVCFVFPPPGSCSLVPAVWKWTEREFWHSPPDRTEPIGISSLYINTADNHFRFAVHKSPPDVNTALLSLNGLTLLVVINPDRHMLTELTVWQLIKRILRH